MGSLPDSTPSTPVNVLQETTDRCIILVEHYKRDLPFRAPETVPEHQARLLTSLWNLLEDARP